MIPPRAPAVVCPSAYGTLVRKVAPSLSLIEVTDAVALLDGPAPDVTAILQTGLSVLRLLDVHYIVFDPSDVQGRMASERVLFDRIADVYDYEVDRANNLHNIGILLDLALSNADLPASSKILDYGCGTGLSALAVEERNVRILAFDVSSRMLDHASKRGLKTLSPDDMLTLADESVDGVIASYVLHLASARDYLAEGIRVLRRGGQWSANFHKGLGLSEVDQLMVAGGQMRAIRTPTSLPPDHGPYRLWQRV